MSERIAYTTAEAAAACGYSRSFITRQLIAGKLKGYRVDGRGDWRVFPADIEEWLRSQAASTGRAA